MNFLAIFDKILSNEQKLLAKNQIYNFGYNKKFLLILFSLFLICLVCHFLISYSINLRDDCQKLSDPSNLNKMSKIKYTIAHYIPEFIVSGIFGFLIIVLSKVYFEIDQNYSFMSNKFNLNAELLNLSEDQIKEINQIMGKQKNLDKIIIPILIVFLAVVMSAILIYINKGPDCKMNFKDQNYIKENNILSSKFS